MTRAELMRHALSQALRRVHLGPKKLKLDEETRWQIAGEAVEGAAPLRRLEGVRRGGSDEAVGERLTNVLLLDINPDINAARLMHRCTQPKRNRFVIGNRAHKKEGRVLITARPRRERPPQTGG